MCGKAKSAIPPGSMGHSTLEPVVGAALDHRLMSATLRGRAQGSAAAGGAEAEFEPAAMPDAASKRSKSPSCQGMPLGCFSSSQPNATGAAVFACERRNLAAQQHLEMDCIAPARTPLARLRCRRRFPKKWIALHGRAHRLHCIGPGLLRSHDAMTQVVAK